MDERIEGGNMEGKYGKEGAGSRKEEIENGRKTGRWICGGNFFHDELIHLNVKLNSCYFKEKCVI